MSRQGEARERNLTNVKNFWNQEANEWGSSPRVTIRDHYFRTLEIKKICELIQGGSNALDIGCGTGFSTLFYSQYVEKIVGADYAEQMVEVAQQFLDDKAYFQQTMQEYSPDWTPALKGNVRFETGNIMDIDYPDDAFDTIVGERVLINLPVQDMQDDAVREVQRVLQPGGKLVLVEVTQQGHAGVDELRTQYGLPILEKYWHNLYIDEAHLADLAAELDMELKQVRRFETYHFLTKIMHPLVVAPDEPKFLAGYNQAAHEIGIKFPDYASVAEVGIANFLNEEFRPLLEDRDPGKLAGFDRVAEQVIQDNPDFSMCSHQVLFEFVRN